MRINSNTLIVIFIITVILTSCDPGVDYDKIIQNDSDFDLMIYFYPDSNNGRGYFYRNDSLWISKHTESSIYKYSGFGQTFEYEDCYTYADSIVARIIENDTLHLSINLNEQSNWNFSISHKTFKKGGTCQCKIIITNDLID